MSGLLRLASKIINAIGVMIGFVILMESMTPDVRVLAFIYMPLTVFFAVLVHELGHACIGSAVGMNVRVFAAYPFELNVAPMRIRWVRRSDRRRLGGFVRFHETASSRRARIAMIAAGSSANILLAALAAVPMIYMPWPSTIAGESGALFWASGSMAIANLLPYGQNDGAMLISTVRLPRHAQPIEID